MYLNAKNYQGYQPSWIPLQKLCTWTFYFIIHCRFSKALTDCMASVCKLPSSGLFPGMQWGLNLAFGRVTCPKTTKVLFWQYVKGHEPLKDELLPWICMHSVTSLPVPASGEASHCLFFLFARHSSYWFEIISASASASAWFFYILLLCLFLLRT